MSLSKKQIMALSDAMGEVHRMGLVKRSHGWIAERSYNTSHDGKTIKSLVDRGYLQLYVCGTVAHITDMGIEALQ